MMMVVMVMKMISKMMMVMQLESYTTNYNHKDLKCQSPHPLQLDQPPTELARSSTGITCAVAELELLDVLLVAGHVLKEPISNPSFWIGVANVAMAAPKAHDEVSALRVFLHRGPFSDSTQFWLKTKEQLVQAMVGLRKSTFDPVDRQIHCWPSNTLVTVKQFWHTYVRFETPVQRCWWWSVNCDKYDVWWWYFCWKFEVFTQKQATQLMQIIFYWRRFIELRAMQLLWSTKIPTSTKKSGSVPIWKSKRNGSKAVVLIRLDNSQIIMFERPKISLACVLRAWLCCSNVNFLHKIGGKTFLWPSLPAFYLFRQCQVPLTFTFVPASYILNSFFFLHKNDSYAKNDLFTQKMQFFLLIMMNTR